jgi:hypothetical protein
MLDEETMSKALSIIEKFYIPKQLEILQFTREKNRKISLGE